jgi:hypothetical protein
MQLIKAINEWGFQVMFLVLWCTSSVWFVAGAVEGVRWLRRKQTKTGKQDA